MKNIKFRKNIEELKWYSSWKWEFSWKAEIFLDTNENPYDLWWEGNNRYPDPMQVELKNKLIEVKEKQFWIELSLENIMVDSWSDNIIDLLVRIFCEPGKDSLSYFSPTFWMYKVAADINNVWIKEFELDKNFEIRNQYLEKLYSLSTEGFYPQGAPRSPLNDEKVSGIKLIFICNPNNPTWNITANLELIEEILQKFNWVVVVDEAYIDFCPEKSALKLLEKYNNLVVLQTFSKLWWLAWVRCWMAFSNSRIIEKLNLIKSPYNVSNITQELVIKQLKNYELIFDIKNKIINQRDKLSKELEKLNIVKKVYKSDSNFLLVEFVDWDKVFEYLKENWIIVRDFSQNKYTYNCLRISIWKESENIILIEKLKKYS